MSDGFLDDIKRRMEGAFQAFLNDLKGLRTGRANTALLDNIVIEVYGSKMPLNQVATVSVPEPRMLSIQVWDRNNTSMVEKAITQSDLGLNPIAESGLIRVPLPDLSEDRRRELVKVASQYAEKSRVSIRNVRRDGMDRFKKLEKESEISEDDLRRYGEDIQELTDSFIKKIDDALAIKEKDILEV